MLFFCLFVCFMLVGHIDAADDENSYVRQNKLNKSSSDIWRNMFNENNLDQCLQEARKIYGDTEKLYRIVPFAPCERKKMIENLNTKKDTLLQLVNTCLHEKEDGEQVAREIMYLVGYLEFSIVEAQGGAAAFKLSPRVHDAWSEIRGEFDMSLPLYQEAVELHKLCTKKPQRYDEKKEQLLKLIRISFDLDNHHMAVGIARLVGDLEYKIKGITLESPSITPRTQKVLQIIKAKEVAK